MNIAQLARVAAGTDLLLLCIALFVVSMTIEKAKSRRPYHILICIMGYCPAIIGAIVGFRYLETPQLGQAFLAPAILLATASTALWRIVGKFPVQTNE